MSSPTRRRLAIGGVAVSLLAIGVDAAAPGVSGAVRDQVARVATPVFDRLTLRAAPGDEQDALRDSALPPGRDVEAARELERLLGAPAAAQRRVVPARVIAFTPRDSLTARQSVTIDVGTRDGIGSQQTVIATEGLVGRTTTVRETSADVELITSPGSVVGARVVRNSALGSVAATPPPAVPRRSPGELTLTLVELGAVRVGDVIRTLGSVDSRPYVRDVVIGTVTQVDPDRGQLGRTARVRPSVQLWSLDIVGVIQPGSAAQRPVSTGTATP